ncbi:MAG: HAMP domain-containing histidine kinase [Proteobacteria bacterium]|nr:HAMP domain-containing histidine kinase [Pseudomonadota bacterium]
MAQATVLHPFEAVRWTISRAFAAAARRIRLTVALAVLLIAGSFASAALIQMRLDRTHALDQAAHFTSIRSREIATDLSTVLDRYAAIGTAFANSSATAETSAALSEAGGPALRNLVLLDLNGNPVSELKSAPKGLLPLSAAGFDAAHNGRVVAPSSDGQTFAILFRAGQHIVAVQLDAAALLPRESMENAVVATSDGALLVIGKAWAEVPPSAMLALGTGRQETRLLELDSGNRLVSLAAAPGWPITVGSSMAAGEALDAWYGSLPLYLFFILGPALAGAGLAVVFVREFERRARTSEAMRTLRATNPSDARLLIRLADAERRAIEADRSKAEFIAHMSHELRTPLNAIIGFSEIIEQGIFGTPGHPKYVEYARDINSAGRHLHSKIGDILDFANLEAGKHPLVIETIDVAAVARETIDELAGGAFTRRLKLTVSLPDSAKAVADRQAVKRILTNLLANALQYTPEGGSVRVQVRSEEGAIVATVRDSGYGFATDEVKRAGEAFAHFNRPGATTGTGMGLAVSMALARRMGGALKLDGVHGEGTSAELRLPKA